MLACALAACGGPAPDSEPQPSDPPATAHASPPADAAAARLAGTWRLVRTERQDQRGTPLADFVHRGIGQGAALGLLLYDDERFGMVVQREAPPSEAPAEAPDPALAALARYTARFGRYAFDEPPGRLTHRITGGLDPTLAGGAIQYRYELDGGRLVLMPPLRCPDSFVTDRGCGYGTTGIQLRHVWERLEPAADLGPDAGALLGFWALDRVEPQAGDGAAAPARYAAGSLIYMPSGQMAVQLMRAGRRPWAGAQPTPAEARAAIDGYVSFFGSYRVAAGAAEVEHDGSGHLDAGRVGAAARRAFALGDDGRLRLEAPAADRAAPPTTWFWRRPGAD